MAAAEQPELSTLLISALLLLSSSPLCATHLLNLLAFLSPLLATTALLLASLGPPSLPCDPHAETTPLRAAAAVGRALEKLRRRWTEDECQTQDFHHLRAALEVYRMVFQAAEIPVRGEDCFQTGRSAAHGGGADGNPVEIPHRSEEKLQEEIRRESTENEKAIGAADGRKPSPEMGGDEVFTGKATEGVCSRKLVTTAPKEGNPESVPAILGSFGSMRKEKEWKRTLACKLFEERHGGNAGEDMDSLWETYESEPKKMMGKNRSKRGAKTTSKDCDAGDVDDEESEAAKLCCLQALKFSAGKMNLGMGRPGLLKISKAMRGIGWLHLPVRHGRKTFK